MYTLIGCWENTGNEKDAIFIYLFIYIEQKNRSFNDILVILIIE